MTSVRWKDKESLNPITDLTLLGDLTEENVLNVIRDRYKKDQIYTNCGGVLLAVNPFKTLSIYSEQYHEQYDWQGAQQGKDPHIFQTAATVYKRLQDSHKDQVILVSGESGAGKTESAKFITRHLMNCGDTQGNLHDRIILCDPLLEAFGNARTQLNTNSSRFAKYLQMDFGKSGTIVKASIRDYMLEKSRVTHQSTGETNFHIFYGFLAGLSTEDRNQLSIKETDEFRIADTRERPQTPKDAENYKFYMDIMEQIGLTEEDGDNIKTVLGAILHLTNISFVDQDDSDTVVVWDETPLGILIDLLETNQEDLAKALVTKKIKIPGRGGSGEEIDTFRSKQDAEGARDSLAKSLYERLFGWLIRKINENLSSEYDSIEGAGTVGIVDICGFESLRHNSFEQMCINLVNEKMQHYMNEMIFKEERKIYLQEEIQVGDLNIQYKNNDDIIDMFMDRGILMLIDENTNLKQGTDKGLVFALTDKFSASGLLRPVAGDELGFKVVHYASKVVYDAQGFLEKNRDAVSPEMVKCMTDSGNVMVSDLFKVKKGDIGTISVTPFSYRSSVKRSILRKSTAWKLPGLNLTKSVVKDLRKSQMHRFGEIKRGDREHQIPTKTVVGYFKTSLADLVKKLDSSEATFVRCIKPNEQLQPNRFDERKVTEQLRYNGIAEVARIRKTCWPVRRKYEDMLQRYKKIPGSWKSMSTVQEAAKALFHDTGVHPGLYALGKSRIFMKEETLEKLELVLWKEEEEERKAEEKRKKEAAEQRKREKEIEEQKRKEIKNGKNQNGESTISNSDSAVFTGSRSSDTESDNSFPSTSDRRTHEPPAKPKTKTKTSSLEKPPPLPNRPPPEKPKKSFFWDIFREVDSEIMRKEAFDEMTFRIVKVFVYIILFLLVLLSSVGQRLGLLELVKGIKSTHDSLQWQYVYLTIAICIPYTLTCIVCFSKWLFGSNLTPGVLTWLTSLIIEALHAAGLVILVFWVLPKCHVVQGALIMSSTAFFPALLQMLFAVGTLTDGSPCRTRLKTCFDVLAIVCQASAVPMLYFSSYIAHEKDYMQEEHRTAALEIAALVIGLILTSLKYWENFVDGNVQPLTLNGNVDKRNYNRWFTNKLMKIRFELQEGRDAVLMVASVLKIVTTGGMLYGMMLLRGSTNHGILTMFKYIPEGTVEMLSPIIWITVCAGVLFASSYIACKLQMQIVSFAIPSLLASCVTVGLLVGNCHYDYLGYITFKNLHSTICWHTKLYLWLPWFLSLFWTVRHVWFPTHHRLEEYDRLFVNPFYCGVLTSESMLLNRRRHREEVAYFEDAEGNERFFILDPKPRDPHFRPRANSDEENEQGYDVPFIYACATMWHEIPIEMVQLLKSLFRLDKAQAVQEQYSIITKDTTDLFYFQAHVFFDDSLELTEEEKWVANSFVRTLVSLMDTACSAVHEKVMHVHDPVKVITPYGAQLIWEMPGGNNLYVHVKDKNKIRHRKRWSQVMYMYYLLGYQLLKGSADDVLKQFHELNQMSRDAISRIFTKDVQKKTKNTYILALDGDTDFSPGAVRVLLDKMETNDKVGAVCGRIHPIGSGPMVWYQKFEYAVGHWMQKATEHVLGCVLCSPGCFSLFRAAALMDNNIMKKYTTLPTEASHYLQYDQGEDRWLCTLMLQQGYRVDYAAAADAYTYAPEGFNEFFNQRRRWTPSTLANILDLLSSAGETVAVNSNISYLYILYQIAMMFGTVLGPGTVIMMIAGAVDAVFGVGVNISYVISLAIPALYTIICFTTPSKIQLLTGAVLSAIYTFIMMAVIAGTVVIATQQSPFHPSVIFTCVLFLMFFFAGIVHWKEKDCLPHCLLYFLCIPSGYLLLFIYSMANLNNVSWGTREVAQRKTKKELAAEKKAEMERKKNEKKKDGLLARLFFNSSYVQEIKQLVENLKPKSQNLQDNDEVLVLLRDILTELRRNSGDDAAPRPGSSHVKGAQHDQMPPSSEEKDTEEEIEEDEESDGDDSNAKEEETAENHWVNDQRLGSGQVMNLSQKEEEFWTEFIGQYLKPIEKDEHKEKNVKSALLELRTNVCFAITMVNCLWIALNYMFQVQGAAVVEIPLEGENSLKVSVLGLMFIMFFSLLIFIQFVGMLMHRWETFLHLVSITRLRKIQADVEFSQKVQILSVLEGNFEVVPDYDEEEEEEQTEIQQRLKDMVSQGQTARDLAQTKRETVLSRSRNPNFPDLRKSILKSGLNTLRSARFNKVPLQLEDDELRQNKIGLRNRHNPALNHLFNLPEVRNALSEESHEDDEVYSEIKEMLPNPMGRDLARNVRRMRREPMENGFIGNEEPQFSRHPRPMYRGRYGSQHNRQPDRHDHRLWMRPPQGLENRGFAPDGHRRYNAGFQDRRPGRQRGNTNDAVLEMDESTNL